MKLIVVDDNNTFREGIKYYLENILNHEVIGLANNGAEFLSLRNKHQADIILMDIEMPVMNGNHAAREALWENRSLRFIAITSFKDKAYLKDLIYAGFKACIFKDRIYDDFETTLNDVMNDKMSFPNKINLE